MAKINTSIVKTLNKMTGVPTLVIKKALAECKGEEITKGMTYGHALDVLAKKAVDYAAWSWYYSGDGQDAMEAARKEARAHKEEVENHAWAWYYSRYGMKAMEEAREYAQAYRVQKAAEEARARAEARQARKEERARRAELALEALMKEVKRIKEGGAELRQKCLNVWASARNLHYMCRKVAASSCDFKFDLQLFAARKEEDNMHLASKSYVKSLKSNKGNAMAFNVKVTADKYGRIHAVLNREMAEITALNEMFLQKNLVMADLRGKEIIVDKAFWGYATLDISACVSAKSKKARNAGSTVALNEIFIGKSGDEFVVCVRGKNDPEMIVISGKDIDGNRRFIPVSEAIDGAGHTKAGWMRFNAYKLYGASKGRKHVFDMYEHDSDFRAVLDKATYGELSKVEGLMLNGKETAEAVTRLGSKSCRMGSTDIIVENVTIALKKDSRADGTGVISNLDGIKGGHLIQCRPYTAKGAALVVASEIMAVTESNYKVVAWDKRNLTKRQEEILDTVLNKHIMRVSKKTLKDIRKEIGADAIRLVGNPDKGTQVFADLNFFKDMWDYKRDSGLNVLEVACFTGDDFGDANTSGQMLKLPLRAIRESGDKALMDDWNKFIKGAIDAAMKDKVKKTSIKEFDGTEMVNPNYFVGAAMSFNSASWKMDPGLYKAVIEEKVKSLKENMLRDRFKINGHSAMVTVDLAHFVTNGRHTLLNTVVENGEVKYFEVFDPVANRYFDQHPNASRFGAVIKYPSMGTKEGSLVYYVSEQEMIERINASGMTSHVKELMKKELASFKEGAVMVPNSLEVLAIILAGFDEDGDHLEMLFASEDGLDIPSLLKRAGFVGAAVNIIPPKGGDTVEEKFGCDSWAKYSYMIVESGNKAVGTVTNCFRLFTDGLLQDLNDPEVHNFYKGVFGAIGCQNGKGTYKSVVPYQMGSNGIKMYVCEPDAMQKFMEAIVDVDLDNLDNIYAMLDDLDKLGRFCQELTIDAQKKFYNVFCDWMDKLNDYGLFVLDFGIELQTVKAKDEEHNTEFIAGVELVESLGYTQKGDYIYTTGKVVKVPKQYSIKYVLADAFTRYRVYAINVAMKHIRDIISEYQDIRKIWYYGQNERDTRRSFLAQKLNARGLAQVFHIVPALYTLGTMYSENMKAAEELIKNSDLTTSLKKKLERDIVKSFYADYGIVTESISNEIRRICKQYRMSSIDMTEMLVLDPKLSRSNVMTKILREERLITMINNSDMAEVKIVLRAPKALKQWLIDTKTGTIEVAGGVFYNIGCPEFFGTDVYTDLVDGKYTLVEENGELYAVRPGREFVDMSNVVVDDDCHVISDYILTDNVDDVRAVEAAMKNGEEYTVFGDTGKRHYAILDKDGNEIVKLNFGSRNVKVDGSEEPTVLSEGSRGFVGKLVGKTFVFSESDKNTALVFDKNVGRKVKKYFFNYILVLKK